MIDHVRGVASLFHFSLLAYLEALISVHAKCRCICVALAVTLAVEILNDKHPTPKPNKQACDYSFSVPDLIRLKIMMSTDRLARGQK